MMELVTQKDVKVAASMSKDSALAISIYKWESIIVNGPIEYVRASDANEIGTGIEWCGLCMYKLLHGDFKCPLSESCHSRTFECCTEWSMCNVALRSVRKIVHCVQNANSMLLPKNQQPVDKDKHIINTWENAQVAIEVLLNLMKVMEFDAA